MATVVIEYPPPGGVMEWVAFHQSGGPLSFTYPRDWTIHADDGLQLVSPSGSVVRWAAYRAPDDRGEDVAIEQAGPQQWTLSRRRVVVKVSFEATSGAAEAEREVVEAIVQSTRPDPGLSAEATAFVHEVLQQARDANPDRELSAEGMALRLDGQTVVDLGPAFRDVDVHPHSRASRIGQILALLILDTHPLASWDEVQGSVFPLLVPVDAASYRHTQPFNEVLAVAYAVDLGPIMRRITAPHLSDWGVEAGQLHEVAVNNLTEQSSFRGRSRPEASHTLTVVGGHTFATAEILLPRFRQALVPRLGETFFAALPSRDVVAAAALDDESEIRRFASWAFAADAFPCTDHLFTSRADGVLDP